MGWPRQGLRIAFAVGLATRLHAATTTELAALYSRERCDAVIQQTTAALAQPSADEPGLRYLRGLALYRVGWFRASRADLLAVANWRVWPGWSSPKRMLSEIEALSRLAPSHERLIGDAGEVWFRVYDDDDGSWSQALRAALPLAHAKVCEFYGAQSTNVCVFAFHDHQRYEAFFRAYAHRAPTDWQWAAGGAGLLLFSERDADGRQRADPHTGYFGSTAAHEFSHCLLRRQPGGNRTPRWLNEGLAQCCGALLSPHDLAANDSDLSEHMFGVCGLPLEALLAERTWTDERRYQAYAEAFHLTRYLLWRLGRGGLHALLAELDAADDIDKALLKVCGRDQRGLHAEWLAALVRGQGRLDFRDHRASNAAWAVGVSVALAVPTCAWLVRRRRRRRWLRARYSRPNTPAPNIVR